MFVAKKWCPICLAIIGLIYLELFLLLPFYDVLSFNIALNAIVLFSIALISSYLATVFTKKTIKDNLQLQSKIAEANRFKRNYSLFKMALLASDKTNYKTSASANILLGNPVAKLKIIVVSSPFCGHCKEAHKIIEEVLERFADKVCFDIRFNFNIEKSDEKSMILHQKLVRIYFDEGQDSFVKALHNWFENKDETKLISKETPSLSHLKINELLYEQYTSNQENNIAFTPAIIINNYIFPKEYDRNDLIYFINNLEDDESFETL
jgi:thiol-disulfide isomerase/thioredoxin